jgi:nucleotide-binding universal stress UspA family protein
LKLILLHVVEPSVYQDSYFGISAAAERANQKLVEAARKRLSIVAKQCVPPDLEVEPLVRIGHPHSEIPDTAKALAVDLLVLGTHGSTALHQFSMGSTAERVVRVAPCPVLTVPGPKTKLPTPNLEKGPGF